jgi:two-component system, OmpR family, KDP operon response regulator KdpE
MSRILVIDDEPQIRRFLAICLGAQNYDCIEADDGRKGLESAALHAPDLVVLDLGLPDMDGQEVLLQLREFYRGPVLVLSVRNSEAEKIRALDNGCNDFVEKPFGTSELLARVRALLRTFAQREQPAAIFDDGHLRVDLGQHKVWLDGQPVKLSPKEFELLRTLLLHSGRIVTQQQLLRALWGAHHEHDTHYLRVFIGRLRTRLDDDPANPRYIETEAGVGYRFVG